MNERRKNKCDPIAYPSLFFRRKEELNDFFSTNFSPSFKTERTNTAATVQESSVQRALNFYSSVSKNFAGRKRPMSGKYPKLDENEGKFTMTHEFPFFNKNNETLGDNRVRPTTAKVRAPMKVAAPNNYHFRI